MRLLGIEMPFVGSPAVGGKLRDATRCQQLLELQEDDVLSPAEPIRQDFPRGVINGVPQPTRIRFAVYVTPPFIQLRGEPPTAIQFLRAADLDLHLLGM